MFVESGTSAGEEAMPNDDEGRHGSLSVLDCHPAAHDVRESKERLQPRNHSPRQICQFQGGCRTWWWWMEERERDGRFASVAKLNEKCGEVAGARWIESYLI